MARVGIVGLGNMGWAFAERLVEQGHEVVGFDVDPVAGERLRELGGEMAALASIAESRPALIVTSLPGAAALNQAIDELLRAGIPGLVVAETSTLSVADRLAAHDRLAPSGITLLDAPVSGTPESVRAGRLALFGAGDEQAFRSVEPLLQVFAPNTRFVGTFGDATRLKLICNMLVVIHNAATAEAMALAATAGFDKRLVYDVVCSGVASSRIWEIRGEMMAEESYRPGAYGYRIAAKDGALIADMAQNVGACAPLFSIAFEMHRSGQAMGLEEFDLASLFEVYRTMNGGSGVDRSGSEAD
jgi:L-threonate 2-dehydrogenase